MPSGSRRAAGAYDDCAQWTELRAECALQPEYRQRLLAQIEAEARARRPILDLLSQLQGTSHEETRQMLSGDLPGLGAGHADEESFGCPDAACDRVRTPLPAGPIPRCPAHRPANGPAVEPCGHLSPRTSQEFADRRVSLLLIPGVLFIASVGVGVRLGQRHALDTSHLTAAVADAYTLTARQSVGSQPMVAAGVLLAATGAGLAVQALSGPPACSISGSGLVSWRLCDGGVWSTDGDAGTYASANAGPSNSNIPPHLARPGNSRRSTTRQSGRTGSPGRSPAGSPGWAIASTPPEQIARYRYGLDLAFTWPRLWLVLPDTVRTEITAAFAAAVATGTWAWPYLLLAILWWPAALIGIGTALTGWARARAAVADLTALSEAALDLHGRTLGITHNDSTGPLTLTEGEQITAIVRKGR